MTYSIKRFVAGEASVDDIFVMFDNEDNDSDFSIACCASVSTVTSNRFLDAK